jgi:hypothetical protein
MATDDRKDIEERLLDHVSDAIGGEGSVTVLSRGSTDGRGEIVSHVLEEAEGMGCLVIRHDCSKPSSDRSLAAKIAGSVSPSSDVVAARHAAAEAPHEDRSYRAEMAILDMLRSATRENAVVLAMEELGRADRATLDLFGFLARNVGGREILIIGTTGSLDDDPDISSLIAGIGAYSLVHSVHLHGPDSGEGPGPAVSHEGRHAGAVGDKVTAPSSQAMAITANLRSSRDLLAAGNATGSEREARKALEGSRAIGHHGLELDSRMALGLALTHMGREGEALEAFDDAAALARTLGEATSWHMAMMRRSELKLFSIGEPDSAVVDPAAAPQSLLEERFGIEPLAITALVEAWGGRRDRAERAFCEASESIERFPVDSLILERLLLAMAAASLLEGRFDLAGMNLRYQEAQVLATGTEHPLYWGPTVSLQRGRSLLRLKRPSDAKAQMEEAARGFEELGNQVQSARARRATDDSDKGIMLD